MFFIVGFLLGVFAGVVAQLATGIPLLFGRGLGLLWGDRRLWWTAALFLAIAIGLYFSDAGNKHRDVTDNLQKGFVGIRNTGVIVGAVFVWVIGLLIMIKLGTGWRSPVGAAPVLSAITLLFLGAATFKFYRLPQNIRDTRGEKLAVWEQAVKDRDLETVRLMVEAGSKFWGVSEGLPGGPVIYSVNRGDTSFLTGLLGLHPQPEFVIDAAVRRSAELRNRETLQAVFEAYPESRAALVSAAVSVSIRIGDRDLYDWLFTVNNADPNQLAIKGASHLMNAARQGNLDLVVDLLDRGADLEYLHPGGRYSAENALGASIHSDQQEALEFLLEKGADPNARGPGQFTSLMRAVDQNKPDMIPLLLKSGADPNLADKEGMTALHLACSGRSPDFAVAKILLDAGADPNLENNKGFRPISRLPPELGGAGGSDPVP